jgi:hypothetical protein
MVVGISTERIAEIHPTLYHMAEFGTWDSIREQGLLSTSALLDLFGIAGQDRNEIESSRRKTFVQIKHPKYGTITIRDQRPMSDSKLARCLRDGLTTADWYRILNSRVFFWLTESRLVTLMGAYSDREHLVLEVNTAELLKRHLPKVMLTPMNTGTTSRMAFPRGLATFQPPHKYRFEMNKKKKGGRAKAIVELTVDHSVPDISDLTFRATHRRFDNGEASISEVVYQR